MCWRGGVPHASHRSALIGSMSVQAKYHRGSGLQPTVCPWKIVPHPRHWAALAE